MVGIVLIGQSNSGKSVLGKAVAEKLGIRYISSGDIARSMNDVQDSLNSGELAPEERMRHEVLHKIMSCNISYILDGFPRFYDQYEWLNQTIAHDLVYVYIDVPDEDIISRAKSRNRCDDGSIEKKMKFFKKNTEPMICSILGGEDVYIIENGNDKNINDNISKLNKIVEEYLDANNSKI
jgi:adenylate kinase family enzyme